MAIRVLIVDDNAALRGAVGALLAQSEGFEVVGEADDGPAGVSRAISLRPDVVLMDVDLPTQSGIDAAREIGNHLPTSRTLLFTGGTLEEDDCRRAGAAGVLPKTARSDEILAAIRRAASPSLPAGLRGLSLASGGAPENGRSDVARPTAAAPPRAAGPASAARAAAQTTPPAQRRRGASARSISGIVVDLSDLLVDASALIAELARDGGASSRAATTERLPALLQSVARAESRLARALLDEAGALDEAGSDASDSSSSAI